MSRNIDIRTIMFLNNQVIVADSENTVQISVHKMETVTSKHGLQISTGQTEKESLLWKEIQ